MQNIPQTALVLGATGGIGGEVARRLLAAGWSVRALRRGEPPAGGASGGIGWSRGDAMQAGDVMRAAEGCSVIVHAVNPPGYRDWDRLVLPMLDNTIAAALARQATIVLPGTVYNFGPDAFPVLREDAPQNPLTRKGRIRVQMEQRLEAATRGAHGARAIVVRAGDFFGPRPGSSWFSQVMVRPGRAVGGIARPSTPGIGHQWAYLPDVAATMVALIGRRETLEPFARFHMDGHWDADGLQVAQAVQRVVAAHTGKAPPIRPLAWWLLRLAAPFVTTLRESMEMRYLWRQAVRLDNRRLLEVLGHEPRTPLDTAIETTLRGLGCLPATDRVEPDKTLSRPVPAAE